MSQDITPVECKGNTLNTPEEPMSQDITPVECKGNTLNTPEEPMSQDITPVECKGNTLNESRGTNDQDIVVISQEDQVRQRQEGLAQTVLDTLYDSISKEGLHQPIGLRPDPDSPGNYIIVFGRHRFYVVSKMMKEEVIKSQVYEDMYAEEAELATLTENACRTHSKPNDRLLVLRKWQEDVQEPVPATRRPKRASAAARWANSTKAAAKQAAVDAEEGCRRRSKQRPMLGHCIDETESASDQATVEVEVASEAAEPEAPKKKIQTFRERVKSVTGVERHAISRDLKINNGLTEEQVYVLDIIQCTKLGMVKIIDATNGDLVKRGEIVSLVASGMEVDRAIKEVLGDRQPAELRASSRKSAIRARRPMPR